MMTLRTVLWIMLTVALISTHVFAFDNEAATVSLDLDPTVGDQGITQKAGIGALDTVRVAVYAQSVSNLSGYKVTLRFDPAVLVFLKGTIDSPGERNILEKNGGQASHVPALLTPEGNGVELGATLLGITEEAAPEGDGLLGVVVFQMVSDQETEIRVAEFQWNGVPPSEKDILSPSDVAVQINPPRPTVSLDFDVATPGDQGMTEMSGVGPSDTMQVAFYIRDVSDLSAYKVTVAFDPSALTFWGGTIHSPEEGNILEKNGGEAADVPPLLTEEGDVVELGSMLLGISEEMAPEGDGLLGILTFQVMEFPSGEHTEIRVTNVQVRGVPISEVTEFAPSDVVGTVVLGDTTPPSPPSGLRATVEGNDVSLSWVANTESDLSYYVVYRSMVDDFAPSRADSIGRVNGPGTNFTDTGLSAGTYYYKIAAVDEAGNRSDASAQAAATVVGQIPGTLKWTFTTGGDVNSSPAIGSDGTIYVGSDDYKVYALNPDGTEKWAFETGGWVKSSPAIGSDGAIYVGSYDHKFYALNPDGTERWEFKPWDIVWSSHAIGSDGTIYVGSYDDWIYALSPDGTKKWAFKTGGQVSSPPAIGSDGTIYVGTTGLQIYALNPDGTRKWVFKTGGSVSSSPAIGSDGTIYVASYKKLYALNPDGTERWAFETGDWVWSSPAIGSDGTIYVGSDDYKVYALNPDGTEKWAFETEGWVKSSPAIGSDGTIYVGSDDHKVYALNPDGRKKWEFETGGAIDSSPAIGSDGTIYVGSLRWDNKVYALTSSSRGLQADAPWPKFQHDNRNTGALPFVPAPILLSFEVSPKDTVATGILTVRLTFDQKMDISIDPTITLGKAVPYNTYTIYGDWQDSTHWEGTFVVTASVSDGLYTFKVSGARNTSGGLMRESTDYYLFVDKVAPTTTSNADTLWHIQDITVTLSVIDGDGSGVESTSYRVNGGAVQVGTVILITTEGKNNQIEFWSKDKVGNEEEHKTFSGIRLDKTPPVATASSPATSEPRTFDVAFAVTEALSGLKSVALWYSKDESPWVKVGDFVESPISFSAEVGEGRYDFEVVAEDVAGNEEVRKQIAESSTQVVNRPPELASIGNKTVGEGQSLSFTVSATDPDGDALTYSASNLPSGAGFTPSTRTFSWTPGYDQAGSYLGVRFEVSDGSLTDSEEITITVNETGGVPLPAPIIASITPDSAENTESVRITDLVGMNFEPKLEVKLIRGEREVAGTDVSVENPDKVTCTFDLAGIPPGVWDVAVINPDGQADTLSAGFKVAAPPSRIEVTVPIDETEVPIRFASEDTVLAKITFASEELDSVKVAAHIHTFPPDFSDGRVIKRFYDITPFPKDAAFSAQITLRYTQAEFELSGILDEGSLYLIRFDGTRWVNMGGVVDTVANEVTLSGLTVFSLWGFAGGKKVQIPAPEISLALERIDFGPVPVGSSSDTTLTIANEGTDTLEVSLRIVGTDFQIALRAVQVGTVFGTAVAVTKEGTAILGESGVSAVGAETPIVFGSGASQAAKVAPSRKIGITIRFKPSFLGKAEGTLVAKSNDPENPSVEVPLSGIGVPPPDTTAPAAPRDLTTVPGDGQVTLTWSPNTEPDLSHYVIYRSITSGFTPTSSDSVGRVDKPDTTFTDTGLINGMTYYYRISAVDKVGNESDFSEEAQATPAALAQPDIALSATSHDFGEVYVDSVAWWSFTIYNLGTADLSISSMRSDHTDFGIAFPTAEFPPIAPNDSVAVMVRFQPSSTGELRGTLTVSSNDPDEGSLEVTLTGTGIPAPVSDLDAPPAPINLVANGSSPSPWQNTPSFTLTWTNPPDESGIAKAHYTLGPEPANNEDITSTALGTPPITVEVSQEGETPLYLWLEDGSGNADYTQAATVLLRYDATSPTVPVLQSPADGAWTNTMEVPFVWEEAMDDLSGLSRYLLYVDDVVVDSTMERSLSHSLSQGAHRWAVATEDSAGNVSLSPSWTIGVDIEAPRNPSEVLAWSDVSRSLSLTDGAWYNHPSPHFEWRGASDASTSLSTGEASGVSGYAVRFTTDAEEPVGTEAAQEDSTYTVGERLTSGDTYVLRVRTVDRAGNWSEASTLFTYGYDATPPSIVWTPGTTQAEGRDWTMSVSVTDTGGVQSAILYYRAGGQRSFISLTMSKAGGDTTYEATIPGSAIGTSGLEMYLSASDIVGNAATLPEDGENNPYCVQVTFQDYIAETAYPTGIWKMVGVPVMPDNGSPSEILTALGVYDIAKWRLFRFYVGAYHEYLREGIGNFEPGKAFWLHTRMPDFRFSTGSGRTTRTDASFEIWLTPGWNDISCPFAFPVRWDDVMAESGDPAGVRGPYTYDGTAWSFPVPTDRLEPWEGVAVKNANSDPVLLKIPPLAAEGSTKPLAKPLADGEWSLRVKVGSERTKDVNNFLGFREDAQIEWDRWDFPEPPPSPGEYLRLYFPHEDWTVYPDVYTSDFRPPLRLRPSLRSRASSGHGSEGEVWTFVVEGNLEGSEALLSFEGVSDLPAGLEASLLDMDGRISVDLREGMVYPLTVGGSRRHFQIAVGSVDYVEQATEVFRALPEGVALSQNRPNPFNAETVIAYQIAERGRVRLAIYDLLGREVAVLVDGTRDPGYFSAVWDGRDRSGKEVASGVYLCVLETGGGRMVRKMVALW